MDPTVVASQRPIDRRKGRVLRTMDVTLRRLLDPTDRAPGPTPVHEGDRVREPVGRRVRDAVVGALAVVGTLTVAWIAVSWLLGLSVIVPAGGSSASQMPAGSAAVVHRVPAERLQVGDAVAVTLPGSSSPSRQRIVDIAEVTGAPGVRSLTLRGEQADRGGADDYIVAQADVMIASAPHVGRVVSWISRPVVTMCLAAVAAGAVIWALRPPSGRRECSSTRSDTLAN